MDNTDPVDIIKGIVVAACLFFLGAMFGMSLAHPGHHFTKEDLIKAKVAYHDATTGKLKLIEVEGSKTNE